MKMIKTIITTALLALAISAHAEGMPASTTFEVSIYSVTLPVSPNGRVSIRECEDCDYHSLRVTPQTVYSVNNKTLQLADFREAIADIRQHGDTTVNVKRDEASNTVASIRVSRQ